MNYRLVVSWVTIGADEALLALSTSQLIGSIFAALCLYVRLSVQTLCLGCFLVYVTGQWELVFSDRLPYIAVPIYR